MLWNVKKPISKILSLILACALTVSLLSGCGQTSTGKNGSTGADTKQETQIPQETDARQETQTPQETDAKQKTDARQETENKVRSAAEELAAKSAQTEQLLAELLAAIEQKNGADAEPLAEKLSKQLAQTKEETQTWLSAQQDMAKGLAGEAAETLNKRQAAFEKELEEGEAQAQKLLKQLKEDISRGDMEAAGVSGEQLEALLVEKEAPKTYGEMLPGEMPAQEPGEEEYTGDTEEAKAAGAAAEAEAGAQEKAGQTAAKEKNAAEAGDKKLLAAEGETALNERIIEKAEALKTPLAVYNYLKNNIGYETYYGSRKGAAGTFDAMGGNDIDQASLLIAMLRHLGYPAEYVKGNILLTGEQAVSLTGADTPEHAADILAAAGTPVTKLTGGGETVRIRMEHVWVRAYVPYTDYRGAGSAGGESLWIDLDTSIKAYESVENIYDTLEEEGFSEAVEKMAKGGDAAQIETLLDQWEEKLKSENLSETYARKRIIKNEEISYLPLSLQYKVETEAKTFAQVENASKDRVSFSVNGDTLAGFTASELQGRNILLSFRPASDADKEIYDSYSSIFDIPAYAVYMKPVLLIDNEVAAEGEEYLESTLGARGSFTIHLASGGKNTSVTNDITTGSMYAVTLDSQSITAAELQSVYDEAAALKDSVTEENVYSEAYLGKLLSLAGKLYFAQVDVADTIAADMYDVSVTRNLSEGITGYEVQTNTLYGRVTSLSEGSLYIDVDTDSHSVVSLEGKEDVPREYMMSTGLVSSLYESAVWEQLTGYESVSTVSVLAEAQEENIDILLISKENLDAELKKLNTDEATRQTVINAVNSGKVVTIPAKDVTMGDWHGTGYIVTNPETGAGSYMISGGHNGGMANTIITMTLLAGLMACAVNGIFIIAGLLSLISSAATINLFAGFIMSALSFAALFINFRIVDGMIQDYFYYLETGDLEAADRIAKETLGEGIALVVNVLMVVVTEVAINGGGSSDIYTIKVGTSTGKNPLENIVYTDKVKAQMELGDCHSFPRAVESFGDLGKVTPLTGGDGVTRLLIEIEGSYLGKDGVFQFIIESDGITCNHRLFVPRH